MRAELIEEDGESRYKINDVIGMVRNMCNSMTKAMAGINAGLSIAVTSGEEIDYLAPCSM